jgi:hypothetical protein
MDCDDEEEFDDDENIDEDDEYLSIEDDLDYWEKSIDSKYSNTEALYNEISAKSSIEDFTQFERDFYTYYWAFGKKEIEVKKLAILCN